MLNGQTLNDLRPCPYTNRKNDPFSAVTTRVTYHKEITLSKKSPQTVPDKFRQNENEENTPLVWPRGQSYSSNPQVQRRPCEDQGALEKVAESNG